MGVFIPTMSLPNRCVDCAFCIKYMSSATYCNLLEADINSNNAKVNRSLGCPLVEIETSWGQRMEHLNGAY